MSSPHRAEPTRRPRPMPRAAAWSLVALLALFLYGGLVLTLFRHVPGVSWHGHAFGFLGGALAAWLLTPKSERVRKP